MDIKNNQKTDVIKLFNMTMTMDAFIILIAGSLLLFVLILTYGLNSMFFLVGLSYIALAYRVNCMVVGSCYLYSKIIAVVTTIAVLYVIIDKNNLNNLKDSIVNYKN